MAVPLPRTAVEIPLYAFLRHNWWPPVQLVLARPWRDADENLGRLGGRLSRETATALADPHRDPGRVDIVIEQRARRGPKRAPDSMQFVLQFGKAAPTRAHALLQIWRDRAIDGRRLGVVELADKASAWWLEVARLQPVIDQAKRRSAGLINAFSPTVLAAHIAGRGRESAVIAARGTAALCGGPNAHEHLERAFDKYAPHDPTLRKVELPDTDSHVYDPMVHDLAAAFCRGGHSGLTSRDTVIYTHRRVVLPREDDDDHGTDL